MQIEQIIPEGFLSYKKEQIVDFRSVLTCLVLGQINGDTDLSNGAGKSSLFESIPVCFFGKGSGRADVLDSYINDDMPKMSVTIIFKMDGQRYKTKRTKSRNASTSFEAFLDSTNLTLEEAVWVKTDKTLEEILGLSAKTYSSTIYLNERESLQMITGTSSERKEILRELLNIEIYEKAAKICYKKFDEFDRKMLVNFDIVKDRQTQLEQEENLKTDIIAIEKNIKDIKKDLKENEAKLKDKKDNKEKIDVALKAQKTIQEMIDQQQQIVRELVKNKNELEQELKNTISEVKSQKEKYAIYKQDVKEKIEKKSDYNNKIEELNKKLTELDDIDEQLKQVTKEVQEKTELKFKTNSTLDTTITEAKPFTGLLEKLNNFKNVCPVTELQCPVLKEDYATELKTNTELELKKNFAKREKLKEKIKTITDELSALILKENSLKSSVKSRQTINEQLSKAKLSLQSIENDEKRLNEKEKEFDLYLKQSEKDIQTFNNKIESNKQQTKTAEEKHKEFEAKIDFELVKKSDSINEEIKLIEKEISLTRDTFDSTNQKLGEYKNSLNRLDQMKVEIKHLLKNNEEYTKQKKIYQELTNVFGKDGIQKSIMKQSIPMLEQYASDFLKIFNDDSEKIKVKFDLDPKRQDGEFKKGGGLDILVIEPDKDPKDLQMYSGGETVRIVFSIILSLAKLLSLRAGKKHETLIIDEKIAKLDTRGILQFGEVIHEVSKMYKQVFVITHIESLKDVIGGNEIIVNKTDDEGSLVTVS